MWSDVDLSILCTDLPLLDRPAAAKAAGFDAVVLRWREDAALADARLVIAGEGSLDAQTLHGKAPAGVARGVPVVAVPKPSHPARPGGRIAAGWLGE
ncbi:glycerate kinase [Saccharothrix espanaensis]|uniref:Uncharacterized protein n=1 Tax=Saccharothrix espanaensis (strain ATCC 51144 / DSM 44229 / JCM 9112 / NBRC 15066 / NRRL 15764) TaxID=1179773 RepID=K0K271_SACES|nr:hypothetical protein BN6_71140 [Saccharothrix espanaensis DSM 44229]